MKKGFLTLFVFICLMATIYSGYLLFNKQIAAVPGSALLAVGVIVLIWSWSLARKHRLRLKSGSVVVAIIIISVFAGATGAYAGFEPLAGTKDKVANVFEGIEIVEPKPKEEGINDVTTPPYEAINESESNTGQSEERTKTTEPITIRSEGIVGKWQYPGSPREYIEFFSDGRVVIDDEGFLISGDYELIGDEYLKLYLEGFAGGWLAMSGEDTWKYYISKDTVTINVSGKSTTLTRVY